MCAELEDALEKCRRGEIAKEDYETLKGALKKKLPILTFHATFKNGRRKRLREEKEALRMKDEYWDWSPATVDWDE